jgi:hypothetical protein
MQILRPTASATRPATPALTFVHSRHGAIGLTFALALALFTLLQMGATTPRARLNVLQATAMLIYLAVLLRSAVARTVHPSPDHHSLDAAPQRHAPLLWLSLLLPVIIYSFNLGGWFLGDDFPLLRLNEKPLSTNLHEWFTQGQAGAFLRPLGFASLAFDEWLFGTWPAGFHAVNLLLHLLCVAAVYRIGVALELARPSAATAALFFALVGPGLTGARIYYFGSAALALLLGKVCAELPARAARTWVVAALTLLLGVGLAHNLRAWAHASAQSRELADSLLRAVPTPPPGATLAFIGVPGNIEGAQFFSVGLADAVALAYQRNDLRVVACATAATCAASAHTLHWTGHRLELDH